MLVGLFSLCGCSSRSTILVLDDQWAVKEAAADCESRQREGVPPCTVDPRIAIRDFEAQVSSAFKLEPLCSGMTLVTLDVSDQPWQLNSRHTWWLFPELIRSNRPEGLRYTVSRTDDPHTSGSATGLGEPNSIVREFCKFIREGGNVE